MTTVAKCNLCDTKIQSLYLLLVLLLLLLRFVSTAVSLHRVSVFVSLFFVSAPTVSESAQVAATALSMLKLKC